MVSSSVQRKVTAPTAPAGGRSPFVRLNELLADIKPGKSPISLAVGEPQHPIPNFVGSVIAKHLGDFGRYPANKGTEPFRNAVAGWLERRYKLNRAIDPESEVLVLSGTREGLFLGCLAAVRHVPPRAGKPAVLIPNPFYAAYSAGAAGAGCEPVYLPARKESGFLPDLNALPQDLLARTAVFFLSSPSNPQGAVADRTYLTRLLGIARQHGFMIFADECYSEIYSDDPPAGMFDVAEGNYANVIIFHSLSKRSSLPGLRVGFAAGDKAFLAGFLELRNIAAPQVPVPLQHVAVAAYDDETHVEENRAFYHAKFDLADQIIGNRYGYRRPDGGFFLWLDVSAFGGSETVTKRLWNEAGVRVVPGCYLAREQADGSNPGEGYIRVAMVQDKQLTAEALHRLVDTLG
ncbi:MAG: aminotransferase class I/II-fold pyridoxal phosphate-dependent enzyme [Pseudolabrys sp.]|nr:aminotransferase class I/II-fold pyridoxal phosphate-dependent enzyme [Pseudolabrys sp.]